MNPAAEIQRQIASSLEASSTFAGVYGDAPARAPYPYVVATCTGEEDWSCFNRQGRQLHFELALWDDEPSRLGALDERLNELIPLALSVEGWTAFSLRRIAKKKTRNPAGPWSSTLTLQVRLLRSDEEESA